MAEFVQGDSGTLSLIIQDNGKVIDLTGAIVNVTITCYDNHSGNTKQATITDAQNGKCQIALTSTDLMYAGTYLFQAQVNFPNGDLFSSSMQKFTVDKKIGYIPTLPGAGGSVAIASGANGHILVNGNDVKVYDDADVNNKFFILTNDMNNLITKSVTNGNIVFNGVELKVYDDTSVNNQITNITNMDILKRVAIDNQNKLTVDGAEVIGSGGDTVIPSATNGHIKVNGTDIKVYDDASVQNNITILQNLAVIKRLDIDASGNLTLDGNELSLIDNTPVDGGDFTSTYNSTIVDGGEF